MTVPRTALVTGGTGLLGRAIGRALGREGYRVFLNYHRDEARAQRVARALDQEGLDVLLAKADVTRPEEVRRLIDGIVDSPLDLLVNNVGSFHYKPFLETTAGEWDEILRSALLSAVYCSHAVLPQMRGRGSGSIIHIASLNAGVLRAKPLTLPYAIAKAGIVLLTKTLAATEGEHGIRVNAVSPGLMEGSPYHPQPAHRIPLRRSGDPDEVADAVVYLASGAASYITGAVLDVHGGAFL